MREADLLLHIDAPAGESVFLASKLVDYIGARRPILGITPRGTAHRLIGALGGWTAEPHAPAEIARQLAAVVDFLARRRNADWGADEVRRRYEAEAVALRFGEIIEEMRMAAAVSAA